MNKKAAFPELVNQVVGGAIMVALLIILFAGFSGAFLDFMSDQENIRSFNKFTSGLSKACTTGISTQTYISLSETGSEKYIISAVGSDTASYLKLASETKVDSNSKRNVKKCEGSLCYCLLHFKNGDKKVNNNQNLFVKDLVFEDSKMVAYSESPSWDNTGDVSTLMMYSNDITTQAFKPEYSGIATGFWIRGHIPDPDKFPSDAGIGVELYAAEDSGKPKTSELIFATTLNKDDIINAKDNWIQLHYPSSPIYRSYYPYAYLSNEKNYVLVVHPVKDLGEGYFAWNGNNDLNQIKQFNALSSGWDYYIDLHDWSETSDIFQDFKVEMDLSDSIAANNNNTDLSSNYFEFTGKINPAQEFIPAREGQITHVTINAKLATPDDYFSIPIYVAIYSGRPTIDAQFDSLPAAPIAVEKIEDSPTSYNKDALKALRNGDMRVTVDFTDQNAYVSEGKSYFIVLYSDQELTNPLHWYLSNPMDFESSTEFGVGNAIRDNDNTYSVSLDTYWFMMDQIRSNKTGGICSVTLYQDTDFSGGTMFLTGHSSSTRFGSIPSGGGTSSLKVTNGCYAILYDEPNNQDTYGSAYVSGSYILFTSGGNVRNDAAVAADISSGNCSAVLYYDKDFAGRYVTLVPGFSSTELDFYDDNDWDSEIEDKASALTLTDGCWVTFCEDVGFEGDCKTIYDRAEYSDLASDNSYNLNSNWKNDALSSVKIDSAFGFEVRIDKLDAKGKLMKWDEELKSAFEMYLPSFDGLDVLLCRDIAKDLSCLEDGKMILPVVEVDGKNYLITWLQPDGSNLFFDSYTFIRPINSEGSYEDYALSNTYPELEDINIYSADYVPFER